VITSTSNAKIKLVRALQTQARKRKQENNFIAEGVRLIEEAIAVQWPLEFILYDQTLSERGKNLLETLPTAVASVVYEITPEIMAEISDTETPQGILAVLKQSALPLPDKPTFVILADQVRDPGNMGTMLRTAEATGAEAVLLSPGTVDAFSPKVVRAGMGAHFHLPLHHLPWHEIHEYLNDLPVFLAESDIGRPMWETDFSQPCALLIGGEAFGASPTGEEMATHHVTIPMAGRAESLNAAVAAGILMAEVMRQRGSLRKES
jgi:TrmH family RNA methyltransferase